MEKITEIIAVIFDYLQVKMEIMGIDADRRSFAEIHEILNKNTTLSPEEFAYECFYVVCVAGFKQDYAKVICNKIIDIINKNQNFTEQNLLNVYKNKGKVKAIKNIWDNRESYSQTFYSFKTVEEKVNFLGTLPYIGNITKHHLARNLGLNFVKYDIWIQRLGVALYGTYEFVDKVNNTKLLPEIKYFCDLMFKKIHEETGEKVGFIDVVLWRACQKGLIKIDGKNVFLNKKIQR